MPLQSSNLWNLYNLIIVFAQVGQRVQQCFMPWSGIVIHLQSTCVKIEISLSTIIKELCIILCYEVQNQTNT